MDELRLTIAKNIASLRKAAGLTQAEFAGRLNYTDKAVSKWERGESLPDIAVLKGISDMFGVQVDYLLHAEHDKADIEHSVLIKRRNTNRLIITLLSATLVWLIATIAFVVLVWFPVDPGKFLWMSYVYAIPVTFIILLVFNSIWGRRAWSFAIISLLVWSILLSIYLSYSHSESWIIFSLGIPAQLIIILWANLQFKRGERESARRRKA